MGENEFHKLSKDESGLYGLFPPMDLVEKFREFKRLLGTGEISREAAEEVFQIDTLRQLAALTTHQADGGITISSPCGVEVKGRSSGVNISFPPSSVSLVLPTWSYLPPSNLNDFLGEERAVIIGERDEMEIPLGIFSQVRVQGGDISLVEGQSGKRESLSLVKGINTIIGIKICHKNGMVTVIESDEEFIEIETRTPDGTTVTQLSYGYVGFDCEGDNPFTLLRAMRRREEVFQFNTPGELPVVMTVNPERYTIQLGLNDDAEKYTF